MQASFLLVRLAAILTISGLVSVPAKTHVIKVWSGYYQFIPNGGLTVRLGDTVQWRPLDHPHETHDIVSTTIPSKAKPFSKLWKAPADTFFQYVPEVAGLYQYECTPHHDRQMNGSFTVQGGAGILRNAPLPSVLSEPLNPSLRELNFSGPYVGYPFALYDHAGKKLLWGIAGRKSAIANLAAGSYHLEVKAGRTHTQKLILR